MKRALPFLIILAIACAAVAAGTVVYRRHLQGTFAPIPGDENSAHPGANPPHFRGPVQAAAFMEEFGDLQCPPCAGVSGVVKKLDHDYAGKLRVVFRQFPLPMHHHAMEAALATEAAAVQGQFWEMNEVLYENQNAWSQSSDVQPMFEKYAQQIGLNVDKFKADLQAPASFQTRIDADKERGTAMGVTATPTLFLNNQRVPLTSYSEPGLRAAIDAILAGKAPFPTPSPTPAPVATATPAATVEPLSSPTP